MKKLVSIITLVVLGLAYVVRVPIDAVRADGQKIKLEVQFLEEGTNKVLADPLQLEGDQGVFASISVPSELQGKYTIESQNFDNASLEKIAANDFYSSKLVYQIFFTKVKEEEKIVQQGTYTLNVDEYVANGKNLQINYPNATDATGKPIKQSKAQSTNFAATFGYYTISEDKVLVWCYDPQLPANHNDKYEKRVIEENEDAALVQNFGIGYAGQDRDPLNASTEQKRIWAGLNTMFPEDPYIIERDKSTDGHYSNDNLRQLTKEESDAVKAFNAKIDELSALYKSDAKLAYKLNDSDFKLEENVIKAKYSEKDRQIKLTLADDVTRQLFAGFANGTFKVADGFKVKVEGDTVTIDVPAETKPGSYSLINMSLIRPEYTGETVEYYSNYGNQPLRINRIAKPKTFELKLEIADGFVPNEPPVVEKPEFEGGVVPLDPPTVDKPEAKIPEVPETPKTPKTEEPKVPETPKTPEKPEAPKPVNAVIEFPKTPEAPKTEEPKQVEEIVEKPETPKRTKKDLLPNTGSTKATYTSAIGAAAVTLALGAASFMLYRKYKSK